MDNNDLEEKTGLGGIYFPRLFFLTEEEVASMKVSQLKAYLEEAALSTEGKKMVLATRLKEAVRVASFFSVEKCEWTGYPNMFRGPVVTLSQEIPNKCLGISSVDAQLVKHRFVNLFMLKGTSKSTAQREAKAWLRTQLYPSRSWRENATSAELSLIRSRQQYIRDFLFGATGAYKATQKNLEYINHQIQVTRLEIRDGGHMYYPLEKYLYHTDGWSTYLVERKKIKSMRGLTEDQMKKASRDNDAYGRELTAKAKNEFNSQPVMLFKDEIRRLYQLRKIAIKKAIEPAHYYIESQPWMYKADSQVGPEELFSKFREWLDSPTLLNTEIPFPLLGDGHRSLFDTQPLHEMEIVVETWIDPETGDELPKALTLDLTAVSAEIIQSDQSRMDERDEFLSDFDDFLNSL